MMISKYIHDDFSTDDLVEWAIKNCPSFEKYMLVELDWKEKLDKECWFRFDVYFTDSKDALAFGLKWL